MTTLSPGTFLLMWLGFLLIMLVGVGAVLVWAVRSRQFADQDRARYLPLQSGIPEENTEQKDQD